MAFQTDIMGGGTPAETAKAIVGSIDKNVTAVGTLQSDATKLRAAFNLVTTTPAASGVMLPTMYEADLCIVVNQGANALLVYPTLDHKIDSAANNIPVTVNAGVIAYFWGSGSGNYTSDIAGISSSPSFTNVSTSGQFLAASGSTAVPSYSFTSATNAGIYLGAGSQPVVSVAGVAHAMFLLNSPLRVTSLSGLSWSSSNDATVAADLFILRDAANVLAQRSGTNAQSLRIYNTFTDASNYERASLSFGGGGAAQTFVIAREIAGTGAAGGIRLSGGNFLQFTTQGVNRWQVDSSGHYVAITDNSVDIGASGATRPRTGYFGTSILAPFLRTDNAATGAAVADTVQFYGSDNSPGNTIPSFYCEGTDVLATGQADSVSSVRVKMRINGTVVTLLAI